MKYEDISAYSHPFAPVVNFVFVSWVLFLPICKSTSDHATYLKDAAHSTVAFTLTTDSKFDSRMSAQLHQEVKDYLTRGCVNQTRVHLTYEKKFSCFGACVPSLPPSMPKARVFSYIKQAVAAACKEVDKVMRNHPPSSLQK